ncbi:MAG: replication factor C large subunit [Nanoarchaeota archaeon]|nr:replication factor C large subunit [Nanoarchaeota archaeon]
MQNWNEKYRPKDILEVIEQEVAVQKIKNFIKNFPGKKKAIILNGPPGIGKTTIVHAFSSEINSEIYELNASDLRNKSSMNLKLKPVLEQKPLFEKNKIILVDEVDGISGTDRGGVSELVALIEESKYPVICTANDTWNQKLSPLRKKCEIIELKEISPSGIKKILIDILKKEKVEMNPVILNKISIKSNGDLRSAINDIEAASKLDKNEVIEIDERNRKEDIFKSLRYILQEKAEDKMIQEFDKLDMPLDEVILWIEENIPKVYSGIELAKAYERLGKVDLFKGRIYKQQYWRFLLYENIFLSYGISEAKGKNKKEGFYKYAKPERILKIWLNNQKEAKKKTIAGKFSKITHVGQKRILKEWREVKNILKNPIIQKQIKLEKDEIDYLMKY